MTLSLLPTLSSTDRLGDCQQYLPVDHVPVSQLFGRMASAVGPISERDIAHSLICRHCALLLRARPAVELADALDRQTTSDHSAPDLDDFGVRLGLGWRAAKVITRAAWRAYSRSSLEREWSVVLAGVITTVLWLAKATVRILAWSFIRRHLAPAEGARMASFGEVPPGSDRCRADGEGVRDRPDGADQQPTTAEARDLAAPDAWALGTSPAVRRRVAHDVFRGFFEDTIVFFRHHPHPEVEPDDTAARDRGFARVVFQGAQGLPMFALLASRPPEESARDLYVLIPPTFTPAIAPSFLRIGRQIFKDEKAHVLIADPRSSGYTDWWAPAAVNTGGFLEGLDLALALADLRRQFGKRLGRIIVCGVAQSGLTALWSLYHAENLDVRIDRVDASSPPSHVGAIVHHLEFQRWWHRLHVWDAAYDVRAFFSLAWDCRRSRLKDQLAQYRRMRDCLRAVGVADLEPTPGCRRSSAPSRPAHFPGDIKAGVWVIRRAVKERRAVVQLFAPALHCCSLIPVWHTERIEQLLRSPAVYRGEAGCQVLWPMYTRKGLRIMGRSMGEQVEVAVRLDQLRDDQAKS